jgi:predicted RND superfamily exporter protein
MAASSEINWKSSKIVKSVDEAKEGVLSTRFRLSGLPANTAVDQIQSMKTLRTAVATATGTDKSLSSSYAYTFMHLYYEQYDIIINEAILNLSLAFCAVAVIAVLLLANLRVALMVVLCIIMVDVDILGLMYLWGLSIDATSIINLVLAVGLSVDYSVHIAHAFIGAKGSAQQRTETAVLEVGPAVFHGAMSTFVAVLVLAFARSYVFRTFFKQFFGICVFGMLHGLLFLPILLSFLGPSSDVVAGKNVSSGSPIGRHSAVGAENVKLVRVASLEKAVSTPSPVATAAPAAAPHAAVDVDASLA